MDWKKTIINAFRNGLSQGIKGGAEIGAESIKQTAQTIGNVANTANEVNKDVLEVVGTKPTPSAAEQAETVVNKIEESAPIIQDTTNNNVETSIGGNWQDWAKEMQERQWEREDAIRAETQAREDSAWQRAVEDMQKAGVNPNLVNAGPAASGGGITSATGIDYTVYEKEMEKELALLEQFIDNEFNASENQKDRLTNLIGRIISMGGLIGAASARKK